MITLSDLYHVLSSVVPLYVAMALAYASVKYWRIFTADQCSGINRFVALFAVPLLSFHFISTNNPFTMNLRFIAADSLQKISVLLLLLLYSRCRTAGQSSLEWSITLFSLSTLPNTLVMGIPLLKGMYGPSSGSLMIQIVVLQCIVWYTLMLFLFEYRGAKILILEQFPDNTAASIVSFRVDSDIVSLDCKEPLQTDAEVGEDGKLHVTVRKSTSSRSTSEIFSRSRLNVNTNNNNTSSLTPRPSNLTNAEIYSLQSSRNPTPRGSSFNHSDLLHSVDDHKKDQNGAKDLHMFVWSSSASPVSESTGIPVFRGNDGCYNDNNNQFNFRRPMTTEGVLEEPRLSKLGSNSTAELHPKGPGDVKTSAMPPASVMTRLILIMVWRKLIRNPNTYSSLLGLVWSLVSFRSLISLPHNL